MDNRVCSRLQFSKRPPTCNTRSVVPRSSYCPHAAGERRGAEGGGGQLEVSAFRDGAWGEPRLRLLVEVKAAGKPPDRGVSGWEESPWLHLPVSALSPTRDRTGISSRRERFFPRQHQAVQRLLSVPQPGSVLTLFLRWWSSRSVVSDSLWPRGLQHARLPSLAVSWTLLKLLW